MKVSAKKCNFKEPLIYNDMQIIREYAVPQNGLLTIEVPTVFNGQRVEVQVKADVPGKQAAKRGRKPKNPPVITGLEKLIGKYKYTPEQNEKIDRELSAMRD